MTCDGVLYGIYIAFQFKLIITQYTIVFLGYKQSVHRCYIEELCVCLCVQDRSQSSDGV